MLTIGPYFCSLYPYTTSTCRHCSAYVATVIAKTLGNPGDFALIFARGYEYAQLARNDYGNRKRQMDGVSHYKRTRLLFRLLKIHIHICKTEAERGLKKDTDSHYLRRLCISCCGAE